MIFTLRTIDRRICKCLNLERLFKHRSTKKHGRRNGNKIVFYCVQRIKNHSLYI